MKICLNKIVSPEGATDDGTTDKRTSQNLSEMEVTAGDDWMQKREVQQVSTFGKYLI